MLTLIVIFLITAFGLATLLYVGGMFLQGYFYTQPSEGMLWQAPLSGVILAGFFFFWMWMVASSPDAVPSDIPYDTLFRFSPRIDMTREPVPKIWANYKGGKTVEYRSRRKGQKTWDYIDTSTQPRRWSPTGVESIQIETKDKEKMLFKYQPGGEGNYRRFVSDEGWTMVEFDDGPTGIPTIVRTSRLLINLALNSVHFFAWFLCLWLLMRFHWGHALGFAVALWLVMTIALLPMILTNAAEVAVAVNTPAQKA